MEIPASEHCVVCVVDEAQNFVHDVREFVEEVGKLHFRFEKVNLTSTKARREIKNLLMNRLLLMFQEIHEDPITMTCDCE